MTGLKALSGRLLKYGGIGMIATAIHVVAASLASRFWPLPLLQANLIGFSCAFGFSYLAQSKFVFLCPLSPDKLLKYLIVQLFSLGMANYLATVSGESLPVYGKILLTAFFLPMVAFFVHNIWTFQQKDNALNNKKIHFFGVLLLIIAVRFYGIVFFPLHDPTEARYAEIARLILETGQWIMPPFDYGVPFWGKPPLTFWLSAISFKVFGLHAFSARLPVFLLAGAVSWMSFRFARQLYNLETARFAVFILLSTPVFFVASGAVMTDMALTFCVTLSMTACWQALYSEAGTSKINGYLFFLGLGLGLLVKGPIVGVLVLVALGLWSGLNRNPGLIWHKLPWIKGGVLMLLVAVPWYVLAEMESPGFIDYFLIGEHYKRFVDSGWQGDLYGSAHSAFRGKIWLLGLIVWLPWSLVLFFAALSWPFVKNRSFRYETLDQPRFSYLLAWALTPLLFFTFSRNILYTYVLPGTPAFALVTAVFLRRRFDIQSIMGSHWVIAGYMTPILALTVFLVNPARLSFEKNQKYLVGLYQEQRSSEQSNLYYANERLFSVDFYTRGKAKRITLNPESLNALQANHKEDFLISKQEYIDRLPQSAWQNFFIVDKYRHYLLLRERQ